MGAFDELCRRLCVLGVLWASMKFLLCLLVAIPAYAEDVNVAAASDLNFAIKEIIQQFEHDTGNKVRLTLVSSGNLLAKMANSALFDVFLSADYNYPNKLEYYG